MLIRVIYNCIVAGSAGVGPPPALSLGAHAAPVGGQYRLEYTTRLLWLPAPWPLLGFWFYHPCHCCYCRTTCGQVWYYWYYHYYCRRSPMSAAFRVTRLRLSHQRSISSGPHGRIAQFIPPALLPDHCCHQVMALCLSSTGEKKLYLLFGYPHPFSLIFILLYCNAAAL